METTEHQFSDIPELVWVLVDFLKQCEWDNADDYRWHIYAMLEKV